MGRIWPFFRKRGRPAPKINITYRELGIGYFIIKQVSHEKLYFWKNCGRPFVGGHDCFEGKGHLVTKIKITFLLGYEILNIFPLTIFSKKTNNIFWNNAFLQRLFYQTITIPHLFRSWKFYHEKYFVWGMCDEKIGGARLLYTLHVVAQLSFDSTYQWEAKPLDKALLRL